MFLSCSGVSVKQDYDVKFDFSKLKNFSWQTIEEKGPVVRNTLVEDRVHESVDNQLSAKGFKKAEIDKVDFFVNYHYLIRALTSSEKDRISAGFGLGSSIGSDNTFGSLGVGIPLGVRTDYEIETLVIDIIDSTNGKLIWRGYAQQKLLNSKPEKTNANFARVVQAILEKFPPSRKR